MGFDLLDFYRGKISLRRMLVLVSQLPEDGCVTRRELLGWTARDYQMANVLDRINRVAYLLECQLWQNSDGKSKPPELPELVWRPTDVPDESTETQPDTEQSPEEPVQWTKKEDAEVLFRSTSIRKRYAKGQ